MEIEAIIEGRDLDELEALLKAVRAQIKTIKDESKATEKAEREAEKARVAAEKRAEIEGKVSEGNTVRIIFKGEETEAEFVKLTEKRFTVMVDGEKRSIMFDKFLGVAE